ncbi:hypothetical protein TNCV_1188211 [Trichonephila clavipes]|nr:hypothetical protein TNCV_1188211 [Trichonephila clavipes]
MYRTAGEKSPNQLVKPIARQPCSATGRQVLRFTMARCLNKGGLLTHRSERSISLKVGRLEWCKECKNWTANQSSRVFFREESFHFPK